MPVRIEHAVENTTPAANQAAKRMFIKSYGCQMNVYDGLRMAELLTPLGYELQDAADGADLVILNTCHIREKADDKMFSDIGRFRKTAADNAIIAVGGCTGQALGAKLMQQAPAVSIVFGPQTYHRLPEFIEKVETGRTQRAAGHKNAPIRVSDTDFPELEKFDKLPQANSYGPSAFLTIQEGCDKFCTYCVVPYTRGAEISRPVNHILEEAQEMAENGTRELVLLGQNVNAYHGEDVDGNEVTLAKLLDKLAEIEGIARLRFVTSHPQNTTQDLMEAFRDNPKLMPFFHLPVQAGSNKILQAMNRSHTAEEYLAILDKVREYCPDIAMSGDFIVGFPGETEEDYQQTLAIAHASKYVYAYSFAYSPRPGTPAADMPNQVPEDIKKERLAGLQAVLDNSQEEFNKTFEGKTIEVLVEEMGGKIDQLRGRSPHNVAVNFTTGLTSEKLNRRLIGDILKVKITEAGAKSLMGELIS
ncbi:MAG: tRNA (N6-isopentenyl adenosine(37)-C2)-methylthiotransferase MiaB [Alphaproteobacteria bacterium]|nr:tRNA (N6-isopentenyl adenosine(37)-C2)-methylthiotransferase MiaB [Alphaproteobacteria bacterium]MDD9919581.1 tRNA (N6-isopentenyl adenosine(37)-C2)-methylthiotransferase MiaB [Alphaproteobacteria bacterium]